MLFERNQTGMIPLIINGLGSVGRIPFGVSQAEGLAEMLLQKSYTSDSGIVICT
jgi:hypothetical protein